MVRPPTPKGRWAFQSADMRGMLVCGACGSLIQGSHRAQHAKWHEFIAQANLEQTQPSLFPTDNDPPPF